MDYWIDNLRRIGLKRYGDENRSDLVTSITSFRATIIHGCSTKVNIAI